MRRHRQPALLPPRQPRRADLSQVVCDAGAVDLRVAVIGSGPAGVYATEALTRLADDVRVDVYDGLPAPFGMVRYAVAPDHPRTQSISSPLATVLEHPQVRFLGNVRVGTDITFDELREHYDAIIAATDLVAWYCGHPDSVPDAFRLDARSVAVIGAGNVAGDVARMLASSPADLRETDAPQHVLDAFVVSQVQDVHLVSRRGPAQTRFTTRELRELGDLEEAEVVVDAGELELDPVSEETIRTSPAARRNLDVLRTWAEREPRPKPRRVHLHFFRRPSEIIGSEAVAGIRLERTDLDDSGQLRGTGKISELPVQLVVRAVGYRSLPLAGLPFDQATGVVPHEQGRVQDDGTSMPGLYVAGWAKRGPTGVIGTNKHDARETVRSLIEDVPMMTRAPVRNADAPLELLRRRGIRVVTWDGWKAIDRAETDLGRAAGRPRAKISDRAELLRLAGTATGPGC